MFECITCNYKTSSKFNFNRHIESVKHINLISNHIKKCDNCGKSFTHMSSYYRHRKHICINMNTTNQQNNITLQNNITQQNNIAQQNNINQQTNNVNNVNNININCDNRKILSKKEILNINFPECIDIDTFIDNFKTSNKLTYNQTKTLLENYQSDGPKAFGCNLYHYLKTNCDEQMRSIGIIQNIKMVPFINNDNQSRSYLEKTPDGWKYTKTLDKLKKLVIISNDQIYTHHNQMIPLSCKGENIIIHFLLKSSDYTHLETQIQNIDKDKKINY